MTRTTEQLIERIQALPDEEQERAAQFMLEDLNELERLREQLQPALEQLDRGEGIPWKGANSFVEHMKQKHGIT